MPLILLVLSILSISVFHDNAFAQETGMEISANASDRSTTISISGETNRSDHDITIKVIAPNGNIVSVDQLSPDANGNFMTEIKTAGPLWKQDGVYTITAQQGGSSIYKLSLQVGIIGGTTSATSVTASSLDKLTFVGSDFLIGNVGLFIMADVVPGATSIPVSGHTDKSITDVTLIVTAPNGNIVGFVQLTPDANGNFMTEIKTASPLWKQDGVYTITAQQGSASIYKLSLQVGIIGGTTSATSVTASSLDRLVFVGSDSLIGNVGLFIMADAVPGATSIGISGHTDKSITDITLIVTAPNGNIVSVDQMSPDANGNFMAEIKTASPLWKQDGIYTITAQQGESAIYKDSAEVEIIDGVVIPEFGTIAAMILAVGIISIIAVSAKTRLGIIPKY